MRATVSWNAFLRARKVFVPVVVIGLTTQAQRPGPRDTGIATATLSPGSLQRMVRPVT